MKSPKRILILSPTTLLALALPVAATIAWAQSDDFSHGDAAWTRQDPIGDLSNLLGLGLGPQVTFSFPASGGYRIQTLPSPDPVDLGPGRGGSIREDVSYPDNFYVAVDLLAWDDTTEFAAGVMGRISNPGAGSTCGYFLSYTTPAPGQSEGLLQINPITAEAFTVAASANVRLYPTNTYRLAFFGQGTDLEGRVYLLPDTNTPIFTVSANNAAWPSGYCGLVQADQMPALNGTTDMTYGHYFATNFCLCDQPQNVTCFPGAAVTLTTSAIGTAPLAYQWTHQGTNVVDRAAVTGSATPRLALAAVTTNEVGAYAVKVTDGDGRTRTSVAATVTLLDLNHGAPNVSFGFNSGVPSGAAVYGDAYVGSDNGAGQALHLTDAVGGQEGSLVVSDLNQGAVVRSFDAQFDILIGGSTSTGNPADGLSFSWATDLPAGPFGEGGSDTGLTVTFEVYDQNNATPGPGVIVKYAGAIVAQKLLPLTSMETYPKFAPAMVRLTSGGRLTVAYNSIVLFDNLPIPGLAAGMAGASFGWGARTGARNDNFWINNVRLTTIPQIIGFSPSARGVTFNFYGVLQSATSLSGPFTDLPLATSPYSYAFSPGAGQMFWRVRAP